MLLNSTTTSFEQQDRIHFEILLGERGESQESSN